jgi:hypothetical protein
MCLFVRCIIIEECPPFLDHCFVYDGFMGLYIQEGKDMDVAIQAARTTIEELMDANNFGITSLEDVEYLGPTFVNTDAVARGTPTGTLQSEVGSGLSAGGMIGIGLASFIGVVGMIGGLAYRVRDEEDTATKGATTMAPVADYPQGTEPFDDNATTGAVASSYVSDYPQGTEPFDDNVTTGAVASSYVSDYPQGTDVIADTGAP